MYILAYLAGVIALWNRHKYLWWFMFAVYVSNVLLHLSTTMVLNAIIETKSVLFILPILIVVIGSAILAIYMLIISIVRKVHLIDSI